MKFWSGLIVGAVLVLLPVGLALVVHSRRESLNQTLMPAPVVETDRGRPMGQPATTQVAPQVSTTAPAAQ
jgi:hypothetical protein